MIVTFFNFSSQRKFECALQHSEKIKVVTPEWITESINSQKLLPEDEYFPLVDSPASPPVSTFSSVKQGSQTPSRLSTPKMNEGTPSTLLTPVTPTVTLPTTREMTPSSMFPTTPSSEPDEIQMKIRNGHHGQAVLKNGDNGSNAGAPVQIIKKEKIEEEPKPVNTVGKEFVVLLSS